MAKRATRNAKAAPCTTLATRQGSQRFTRGMHAMQRFVIFPQMDLHDWLVVWNMICFWLSIQLGMSSSQLTKSYFSKGLGLNHQADDIKPTTCSTHRGSPIWFRYPTFCPNKWLDLIHTKKGVAFVGAIWHRDWIVKPSPWMPRTIWGANLTHISC